MCPISRHDIPSTYYTSLLFSRMVSLFPAVKNSAVRFSIYSALQIRPTGPVRKFRDKFSRLDLTYFRLVVALNLLPCVYIWIENVPRY